VPTPRLAPDTIRAIAHDVGFDLVRFGPADPGEHGAHFLRWLELGRHGEMQYLADNTERILDPTAWRPGVRSAIALAVDYGGPAGELPGGGRIARYATGRDYHRWLRERVFTLRERLAIYPDYIERPGFLWPALLARTRELQTFMTA